MAIMGVIFGVLLIALLIGGIIINRMPGGRRSRQSLTEGQNASRAEAPVADRGTGIN